MARYTDLVKGRALTECPDNYIVVDVETTGFDVVSNDIIEISAVKYRCNRKVDEYSTLIDIEKPVPARITKLTGITNDMLIGAAKPGEALAGFIKFIGDDILIGHNVTFDLAFLDAGSEKHLGINITNNYVDVLKMSIDKLPFLETHKQVVVAKYFGIKTEGSHRALTDCEICNGCYQKLKELSVAMYNAPGKQALLFVSPEARMQRPFKGKSIYFTGIMSNWYINNLKNIVQELGAAVTDKINDSIDMVVVGTADEKVLGSADFKELLELKKVSPNLALIKDVVFIKVLLERKYAVTETEAEAKQMGLF